MNRGFIEKLDQFANYFTQLCERRKTPLIWLFSGIYLVATGWLASQKLMWNDELFTFYIATLPTYSDIWAALLTGGEQIPPLFHVITRISFGVFGVNELAIRLPEVAGFWVMSLCLFRFVSTSSNAMYGFAAMLFPLVTKAYDYAYEARPYGIVLGLAGLALMCWQSSTQVRPRKLSLIGLALSLAAAVANHYYAVLLLVPFAIGEATRSIFRRRIDPAVWAAITFGLIPLLFVFPLIQVAMKQSAIFWARPQWHAALEFYYGLLTPALLPIVVMLVILGIYSAVPPSSDAHKPPRSIPPVHEIAAAVGFTIVPLVAFFLAMFVTGAMTSRYVIFSVIGFSVLFAFAAYVLAERRALVGAVFVISLGGGFITAELRNIRDLHQASLAQAKSYEFLQSKTGKELPIVALELHTFTNLTHYAPREIVARLVYLANPPASLRHLGHSSIDQGIRDLKPWFGLKVEDFTTYIAAHEHFLLYGPVDARWVWLLKELQLAGFRLEMKGSDRNKFLFLATASSDAAPKRAAGAFGH